LFTKLALTWPNTFFKKKKSFDPFERASRYLYRCLHGSSIAHTAVKVAIRRIERTLARKEMLRNTPGQGITHLATAARLCIHDAHSAAKGTPSSRCC
jgi:hypothetical protein